MTKVLVVATSRKTRGGITSVVKAHETGEQWRKYDCRWIETHIDGSVSQKIIYFLRGMLEFLFRLPLSDIVHIHLAAVERKMPFVFFARLFRKKLIIHLHFPNPDTTLYNKSKAWKYRWCLRRADVVVALSKSWKELIEKTLGISNITVVYNPCPQVKPSNIADRDKYILYAGNLSERKGYADLLYSFADVADKCPGWRIVFAGNGEIEKAKILSKKLHISDRVTFLGWITGNDKDSAFRYASVYCLPSYAEGFPMGVLDAWAYGLPVITTPVGGLVEILENKKNALVFNPGNIGQLSECIIQICDKDLRENLSAKSLQLAQTTFNIKIINKEIEYIYQNLSNRKE